MIVWFAVVMTGSLCSIAILHRWAHSRTMRYWEIKYRKRKQNQCNVRRESWLWFKAAQAISQLTVSSSFLIFVGGEVGSKQPYSMLNQWTEERWRQGTQQKEKENLFVHCYLPLPFSAQGRRETKAESSKENERRKWENRSVQASKRDGESERAREKESEWVSERKRATLQ